MGRNREQATAVVRVDWNKIGKVPDGVTPHDIEEAARDASLRLMRLDPKKLARVKTFAVMVGPDEDAAAEEDRKPLLSPLGLFFNGMADTEHEEEESILARTWLAAAGQVIDRKVAEEESLLFIFKRDAAPHASGLPCYSCELTLKRSDVPDLKDRRNSLMLTPVQIRLAREFLFGERKRHRRTAPKPAPARQLRRPSKAAKLAHDDTTSR